MPRRGRLKAVAWLLFAALCQVSSPAQAAFMGAPGFGCFEMEAAKAAGAPAGAAAMAGMDMSAMSMAGMDMSGMDMSGMGAPSPDKDGKAPVHCNYECCNGGLIAHAVLVTPIFQFAGLGPRIAERVTFGQFADAPRDGRSKLRPAIRAPPRAL